MKFVIALTTLFTATLSLACTPPSPLVYQKTILLHVMNSEALAEEISRQSQDNFDVRIDNIRFIPQVKIELTNGCKLIGHVHYLPPEDPGLCPKLDRVELEKNCKKEDKTP